MVQNVFRTSRRGNWIFAAIYGAFLALIIAYGICYLLTHFGIGVVSDGKENWSGRSVFARSALNLYAMHHITLVGSGQAPSDFGGPQDVSAILTLPLTIWAFVPIFALMVSGFAVARMRVGQRRWKTVLPAILGGILYALVLTVVSPLMSAKIGWFIIPSFENASPSPPQIPFHPVLESALIYTLAYGVFFTYLGAILAIGGRQGESWSTRWWACGKAVIAMAIVVQLLIAGAALVWFFMNVQTEAKEGRENSRFAEMLPMAAGMGYALINGASLASGVEAYNTKGELISSIFNARVNMYKGIHIESNEKQHKPMPVYAYALVALTGIAIFMSGRIAVRLGSRDGSIPTAFRITFFHSTYLAIIIAICNIILSETEAMTRSLVYIKVQYSEIILYTIPAVFILSFIGAHFTRRIRGRL